jgi:hypothetical protein
MSPAQPPSLDLFLGLRVVLDTQGPLVYIGDLLAHDDRGYWLADVDVHDRHDGHAGKELYVLEARLLEISGTRHSNRRRVFVERHGVMSVSLLADVIVGGDNGDSGEYAELRGGRL